MLHSSSSSTPVGTFPPGCRRPQAGFPEPCPPPVPGPPPPNQLPPQEKEDGAEGEGGARARARIWTRTRLAELCGITEGQVVEWAILMGNDYTRELSFPAIGFGSHRNRKPEKARVRWLVFHFFGPS